MIKVTVHFPNADYENVALPAVPARGDNFFWSEPKGVHTKWTVSEVDWTATLGSTEPGSVGLVLDPADEAAEERSRQHEVERAAAARKAAEREALVDDDECTCVTYCDQDPKTACSLSGQQHVHPEIPGRPGVYGPCPEHPDVPGDR